jgi:unsaturated rhamnogalacturonyl hydrolase
MIDKTKPLSQRMALSVMNRYTPDQMLWWYDHGLVLQSIFMLGEKIDNDDWLNWVKVMYDTKIKENGAIESYEKETYNFDVVNPGKTLFLLYKKYGEEKYRKAIETLREQLRDQPRTKTGGFWHKKIYPWQMWLDSLYMTGPFYAQYAAEYGDAADFDDAVHQFTLIESKTRDEKTGLLYHAWDESREQRWANPETGCSPNFWGRALGWYCMALLDVLDFIPQDLQKQRESLAAIANRLVAPLLQFQDKKSGLWYQVPDCGGREKNYTESSASVMFVYFFLKMIRLGLISETDIPAVKNAAITAYQGIIREKIDEDASGELHLKDICKGAGLGTPPWGHPYRDGSYEYYVNEQIKVDDFKGVGPFILASMEVEAL